jgi:hypothetical protein
MNDAAAMHARSAMMRTVVCCGVFRSCNRPFAGKSRARANERNHAGKDRPEQGQKDDRLIHVAFSPSSD